MGENNEDNLKIDRVHLYFSVAASALNVPDFLKSLIAEGFRIEWGRVPRPQGSAQLVSKIYKFDKNHVG